MAEDAGIVIIGGGISFLTAVKAAADNKTKITAVCGSPFLEWPMMAPYFIANPERHGEWLSPNPEDFKLKGVNYIFDAVIEIVPSDKKIKFLKSPEITYTAVVVATGNKLPLILPTPGDSLQQRQEEVKKAGAAIKAARTIIVNGTGLTGLEMAGDCKVANPGARVIAMSRKGDVLGTHSVAWQEKVKAQMTKMGIEVMKGTIKDPAFSTFQLSPGKVPLTDSDQSEMEYDVFIPSFMQGPNTAFLNNAPGVLNERKQIIANEFLQSTAHPEIFTVGVSTVLANKHPISQSVADQATTAIANVKSFLGGKPLKKHVSKGLDMPMTVAVAHGKGGYLFFDTANFPPPVKCCCCLPCGGGYPCCPLPCCWCCCTGCSTLCGKCGDNGHSEGAAIVHTQVLNKKFAGMRGYSGMGKAPAQQKMS